MIALAQQEIHALVQVSPHLSPFLCSAIYANPHYSSPHILWDNLKMVASSNNLPWLMVGDFNEVLSSQDKFGGRPANPHKSAKFKEMSVI